MKKITYNCNVCHDDYTKKAAHEEKKIYAAYFIGVSGAFELRELPADTDAHICRKCIQSVIATATILNP